MKRIFIILAFAFLAILVYGFIEQGTLWFPLLIFLGATIGIHMGLAFPFATATKVAMILGLITSVFAICFGLQNHRSILGQILAIGGIFLWSFIGLIGLGTGT